MHFSYCVYARILTNAVETVCMVDYAPRVELCFNSLK